MNVTVSVELFLFTLTEVNQNVRVSIPEEIIQFK